jgi:hypothetical protein
MRQDIIKLFRSEKDITHAIILTHNIDFVFLQSVVLPEFKRCGSPTVTVFADAQCAAATYAYQAPVLSNLGFRYRVVPVSMRPGFCFHPKAVLLSGARKAVLFVGSGNLTFGGWRENGELWLRFDSDVNGTGVFAAFQNYLADVIDLIPLPESVKAEVAEAFEGSTHDWAPTLDEPFGLLAKAGKGKTLVEQVRSYIGEGTIRRLTVCSPYFDSEADAVKELVQELQPSRTEILIQNDRTNLARAAAQSLPSEIMIKSVKVRSLAENEAERQRFLHAKFYALDQGENITVFMGSANCSRAALTIPGAAGNAELLAVQTMSPNEFREKYLDELEFLEGEPELPEEIKDTDESPQEQKFIRLLAARYEAGLLQLGLKCSASMTITGCLVDDILHNLEMRDTNLAWVKLKGTPRKAMVTGAHEGQEILSNLCWIDHEYELRATARGRSFAGTIRNRVTSGQWHMGAWAEVMEEFFKHLQYMPVHLATRIGSHGPDQEGEKNPSYSKTDVFSNSYGLRFSSSIDVPLNDDTRISSLQQLLLRWFEIGRHDLEEEPDKNSVSPDEEVEEEHGSLDRPEKLPTSARPPKRVEISERERKRAHKILSHITEWMGSGNYLDQREPGDLAADLKILSVMMRVGLREGWLTPEDFFSYTQQIWLPLFFSSEAEKNRARGWLDYRYNAAESPEDFAAQMASPALAAAMAAWALAIPTNIQTPTYARFRLACVLAVARLPWLWRGGPEDAIALELQKVLSLTSLGKKDERWQTINEQWLQLMRQGEALRRLEVALDGRQPVMLKEQIRQDHIQAGEVLWQGPRVGFLIALSATKRFLKEPLKVLYLQSRPPSPIEEKPDEAYWSKDGKEYLIPLRALLDEGVILSEVFVIKERKELANFINELAQGFQFIN